MREHLGKLLLHHVADVLKGGVLSADLLREFVPQLREVDLAQIHRELLGKFFARWAVDEAYQVRPPVIVRRPLALNLQLARGKKAVVARVSEVDHPGMGVTRLAVLIALLDGHPPTDEAVELAVVLEKRAGEVTVRQLLDRLFAGHLGDEWIQACERRAEVPHQYHVPL